MKTPTDSDGGSDDKPPVDPDEIDTSEGEPEVNQPGLSILCEAVANRFAGRLPSQSTLRDDGIAGLNSAVSSVPDGMASGILVGVNPIYGLYACMMGPLGGRSILKHAADDHSDDQRRFAVRRTGTWKFAGCRS